MSPCHLLPPRHLALVPPQQHTGHLGPAKAAGLSAVTEKKHQIEGSNEKPGDITIQKYHRGYPSSAFDITVTHPLQKKYNEVAMEEAGERNVGLLWSKPRAIS